MPFWLTIEDEPVQGLHYAVNDVRLNHAGCNQYSQYGEDGLIAKALAVFGIRNRWCFEVGAANGKYLSNTLRLREQGWDAVLIESDDRRFEQLNSAYGSKSICIHQQCCDLDKTLSATRIPHDPDVGIIDIDGNDFDLWDRMTVYRPWIMLVEYNPTSDAEWGTQQAGLTAICRLGKKKGYRHLATTTCNALFLNEK